MSRSAWLIGWCVLGALVQVGFFLIFLVRTALAETPKDRVIGTTGIVISFVAFVLFIVLARR